MPPTTAQSVLLLALFSWFLLPHRTTLAQPTAMQQMSLLLIDGTRYARRTFDTNGRQEGYQELEISSLRKGAEALEVQVTIYSFDGNGQISDTVRTTIECSQQTAGMVMNILAMVEPDGRLVEIRLTGDEILYPAFVARPDTLSDIGLEVRVKKGVVGFLGGKSRLNLHNRLARPLEDSLRQNIYVVEENLRMRFYVLGIKVRERTYRIEETIDPGRGLLKHSLLAPDGSSVTLERLERANEAG